MAGFGISGEVTGLQEIAKKLDELPAKLHRKVMRRALSRATQPTLMGAKRNARQMQDTGALAKSIIRKVVTYVSAGIMVVIIGPRTGNTQMLVRRGHNKPMRVNAAYYAHLVEFGTRPHSTAGGARNAKAVMNALGIVSEEGSIRRRRKIVTAGLKMNPGARARPFLRPAFDATKAQIIEIFAREVEAGLAECLK